MFAASPQFLPARLALKRKQKGKPPKNLQKCLPR
jgi:hypothetical protein